MQDSRVGDALEGDDVHSLNSDVRTTLLLAILKRPRSMLEADVEAHRGAISARVQSARVLVVGAAGSIGAAFVKEVLGFRPEALHLVDTSENGLVEVVRDLRSSVSAVPEDFKALPIPMGSPEFGAFVSSEEPYDAVLNFAALKHVRSEKDPFSLMRMAYTNVIALESLLEQVAPTAPGKVFSVSTDKAVRPESAMGATKALMEGLLISYADRVPVSSARFANVTFSAGSLLESFFLRLAKKQPIAAPADVKRYFISHQEAAELCLLAAFVGGNREIFLPRLDAGRHLLTFSEIAELYLDTQHLQPFRCDTEDEAKLRAAKGDFPVGTWPCFFYRSHTTGEKVVEEFYASDEDPDWSRFEAIGVVSASVRSLEAVRTAVDRLATLRASGSWSKSSIIDVLGGAVPEFHHEEKSRSLDDGI